MQLTADITITITGGIIHIQIERRAITAIIPFTAKKSDHKTTNLVAYVKGRADLSALPQTIILTSVMPQ